MKGAFSGAPTRGVSTLMYVGDSEPAAPAGPPLTDRQIGVGVVGAFMAIFSKSTILRVAGAGCAVYAGVLARKAKVL